MKQEFNMTSLLVLLAILAFGLLIINFFAWMERRRQKKELEKYESRWPSASKKYSRIVDSKLDFDVTEDFYK